MNMNVLIYSKCLEAVGRNMLWRKRKKPIRDD